MSYRAQWTSAARRDMARLPQRAATAVIVYVDERLSHEPYRRSKELGGDLAGLRGARNGDYRIILTVDDQDQVVWVHRVNHRAHVYRSR